MLIYYRYFFTHRASVQNIQKGKQDDSGSDSYYMFPVTVGRLISNLFKNN